MNFWLRIWSTEACSLEESGGSSHSGDGEKVGEVNFAARPNRFFFS